MGSQRQIFKQRLLHRQSCMAQSTLLTQEPVLHMPLPRTPSSKHQTFTGQQTCNFEVISKSRKKNWNIMLVSNHIFHTCDGTFNLYSNHVHLSHDWKEWFYTMGVFFCLILATTKKKKQKLQYPTIFFWFRLQGLMAQGVKLAKECQTQD